MQFCNLIKIIIFYNKLTECDFSILLLMLKKTVF